MLQKIDTDSALFEEASKHMEAPIALCQFCGEELADDGRCYQCEEDEYDPDA